MYKYSILYATTVLFITVMQISAMSPLEELSTIKSQETSEEETARKKNEALVQELLNISDERSLAIIKSKYQDRLQSFGYQIQDKKLINPREAHMKRYPVLFDAFLKSSLPNKEEKQMTLAYIAAFFNQLKVKASYFFKDGLKVYDVGPGEGIFSSNFAKMIAQQLEHGVSDIMYRGIDISEKFVQATKAELEKAHVDSQITHADFRKYTIPQELKNSSNVILISHAAYVMPNVPEFNSKLLQIMQNNAIGIYVHSSDNAIDELRSSKLAHLFKKRVSEDINEKIKKSLDDASICYFSMHFHPAVKFPYGGHETWQELENVKMGAYDTDYSKQGTTFNTLKNMIEFFAGSPLESFNCDDRKFLLE